MVPQAMCTSTWLWTVVLTIVVVSVALGAPQRATPTLVSCIGDSITAEVRTMHIHCDTMCFDLPCTHVCMRIERRHNERITIDIVRNCGRRVLDGAAMHLPG